MLTLLSRTYVCLTNSELRRGVNDVAIAWTDWWRIWGSQRRQRRLVWSRWSMWRFGALVVHVVEQAFLPVLFLSKSRTDKNVCPTMSVFLILNPRIEISVCDVYEQIHEQERDGNESNDTND